MKARHASALRAPRARRAARFARAKARIEKAGVMNAELPDQRIERRHFRRMVGRHEHFLLGGENIKLTGIEHQFAASAGKHRLPVIGNVAGVGQVDVDQAGMALGAIADQLVVAETARSMEIETPPRNRGFRAKPAFAAHEARHGGVVEPGLAAAKTDLRQARARAREDGKGARRDFRKQGAVITGLDRVEGAGAVGDDAGENVDASGRAFRIGGGGDVVRQARLSASSAR